MQIDGGWHKEVRDRYKTRDIAPYKGFVNPGDAAVKDAEGNITDVTISYEESYVDQMLRYSRTYSPLTSKK